MLEARREPEVEVVAAPRLELAARERRVLDSGEFGPVPDAANGDYDRVSEIVAEVNRLHFQGGIRTARAIGEFLIAACFGGNAARIHDKSRHPNSFRALSKREDLVVSASFLFYSVAVTEQMASLPVDVADGLSFTCQRMLLGVTDKPRKVQLGRAAFDNAWSSRELQEHVRDIRVGMPQHRTGRPRKPDFVRAFDLLGGALRLLEDESVWPTDVSRFLHTESSGAIERATARLAELTRKIELLKVVVEGVGDD